MFSQRVQSASIQHFASINGVLNTITQGKHSLVASSLMLKPRQLQHNLVSTRFRNNFSELNVLTFLHNTIHKQSRKQLEHRTKTDQLGFYLQILEASSAKSKESLVFSLLIEIEKSLQESKAFSSKGLCWKSNCNCQYKPTDIRKMVRTFNKILISISPRIFQTFYVLFRIRIGSDQFTLMQWESNINSFLLNHCQVFHLNCIAIPEQHVNFLYKSKNKHTLVQYEFRLDNETPARVLHHLTDKWQSRPPFYAATILVSIHCTTYSPKHFSCQSRWFNIIAK